MKCSIFLLIIAVLAGCDARVKRPVITGFEGKPLPAVSLLLSDSITYINTSSIPAGKPVVLFYFSPQCPYCRAQVAEIVKDMDALKDIQIYMITGFPIPEIRRFLKEYQLTKYTNVIMGRDSTEYLAYYFKVPGVPYMAIYGKDRKLRNAFIGQVYGKQIKEVAMK